MNAPTETIDYQKLKQAKSLAECLGHIPERYFEQALFFLLGFFILTPIIMVALLNGGVTFFNPYYLLLQMGYVGMVVSSLCFYRRRQDQTRLPIKCLKKTAFKQWLWQYVIYLCLAAVLLLGILATVFSTDVRLAFFGDYYRKEGLLTIGAYAGIFMAASGIRNEKLKKRLVELFVLSALFLGIIVILQGLGMPIKSVVYQFGVNDTKDYVPWAAIFHNINHYGYYLTIGITATAGLFVFEERMIKRFFWSLVFSLLTWVLIKNNTFGAYLGVCAGLFLLLGICFIRKAAFNKTVILLVMFIGISLVANGLMGQVKSNFVVLVEDTKKIAQVTVATAEDKEDASVSANMAGNGRWILWKGAIEIMKEHPLLGVGPDNLGIFYDEMGIDWDRPHNEFLQVGVSMGVPAMLFYISALGLAFFQVFRNLKEISTIEICIFSVVCAYLVSAMFGNTMYYTYPYFLIFLAITLTGVPKPVGEVCHASDQSVSISTNK